MAHFITVPCCFQQIISQIPLYHGYNESVLSVAWYLHDMTGKNDLSHARMHHASVFINKMCNLRRDQTQAESSMRFTYEYVILGPHHKPVEMEITVDLLKTRHLLLIFITKLVQGNLSMYFNNFILSIIGSYYRDRHNIRNKLGLIHISSSGYASAQLPGCFRPWIFSLNIELNMFPLDHFLEISLKWL